MKYKCDLFQSFYSHLNYSYRENFEKLKNMKSQIEHSQRLIERTQVKLQKDFENWWNEQCAILVLFIVDRIL